MAFVTVQTKDGLRQVRVCDYCKTVCIPSGRFCSGRCAREYERRRLAAADEARATKMLDLAKRAAYHFTSDTITPRTEPLSDEELDALVQDDMDAMRDWRETSDQLDGPEKGGDQ